MSIERITHSIVLPAGAAAVFDVFAKDLGNWWPLAYTFSGPDFAGAGIEPRVGGVWFERNTSGVSVPWGEVRAYEPGARLVLAFGIGPDRKPASNEAASEVEVRFTPATAGRTRVEIEHRDFARHGDAADVLRAGMDSPQGWPLILAELKRWMEVCDRRR